jgi:hypothetical protein
MSEKENSKIGCCDGNKIPVTAQVHQVEERSAVDDAKKKTETFVETTKYLLCYRNRKRKRSWKF